MSKNEKNEKFSCVECKHHLRIRQDDHKIICALTLELKERWNPASCEYAERHVAIDSGRGGH